MKITLSGDPLFHFEARNAGDGLCRIGASKSIGGDESGFRPMELVLAALGSCSAVDVVNILKKSRVAFDKVDVEVEGERVEGVPSPFKAIHLKFTVEGPAEEKPKAEKAVSLAVEKYCSVVEMLKGTVAISHSTHWSLPG